jgi:hypothetical protein
MRIQRTLPHASCSPALSGKRLPAPFALQVGSEADPDIFGTLTEPLFLSPIYVYICLYIYIYIIYLYMETYSLILVFKKIFSTDATNMDKINNT